MTQRENTSCHKTDPGIHYRDEYDLFEVQIRIKGIKFYLGSFKEKEKALQIYQRALENVHLYDGDYSKFRELINS